MLRNSIRISILFWLATALSIFYIQAVSSASQNQSTSCSVNTRRLNVRSGPGTNYSIVGQITRGSAFSPIGRTEKADWILGTSSAPEGWVAARYISCTSIQTLPIISTPAPNSAPTPALPKTNPTNGHFQNVELLEPLGNMLRGRLTFRWQTQTILGNGEYFEVILWPAGSDPLQAGFGVAEVTKKNYSEVNLNAVATKLPQLLHSGEIYEWGVVIVEAKPYRRIKLLGSSSRFKFEVETVSINTPIAPPLVTATPIAPPPITATPTSTPTDVPSLH